MKKQVILFLLLLSYLQVVANPPNDQILFIEGHLSQVEQLAAKEGKPYFVHFTAQWCMPCQWMEKNTFNNPELAQFVNQNFLAVKIDIDQPEGQAYKKEYLITNLPSILIFNPKGQLKARWETSLDPEQLLQILRKHNTATNRQTNQVAVSQPEVLDSPKPVFATTLAAPKPNFAEQSANTNSFVASSAEFTTDFVSTPIINPGATYGIQLGVFGNYRNAVGEVMRLEPKVKHRINLVTDFRNGKQIYKIVVGRFSNRTVALANLTQLRRQSINGIIKVLDE